LKSVSQNESLIAKWFILWVTSQKTHLFLTFPTVTNAIYLIILAMHSDKTVVYHGRNMKCFTLAI
jgi:hypothetical protein